MAYEKTNWSAGDVVTAEKLNKLENAIVGNVKDVSGEYEYTPMGFNEPITETFNNAVIENDLENNIASAPYAHAEGRNTRATGEQSHAEGVSTRATGEHSHAEGTGTTASGRSAHAEGNSQTASGNGSHAEGSGTTASGDSSHAEGGGTTASGNGSHAEGGATTASGDYSHSGGYGTQASEAYQTAIGKYNNYAGPSTSYAFIIGNGTDDNNRSNAFAIKWDGTLVLADGTEVTVDALKSILPSPAPVS